jgi:hypothetical protein
MIINDLFESTQSCPECGGPAFSDLILAEKKDACYHKVKASAKVWPSAYASGRLVQCRKKGADNWGNKSEGVAEGMLDNPGSQDSPVAGAIIRRILMQRTDLLSKYGPERVGAAVDEVADFVGDVDEIGSSDVSGWIRHVEQMLGNMDQGVAEGLGKTIKRGMAGWGAFDKDKPADVVKRVRGQDTDTLKGLSNRGSTGKGSPAELQQKAISRELKKRGEQGVAEAGYRDRRDAYQRDYDSSVADMGKRQSYAYSQDGGANDEDHSRDEQFAAQQARKQEYERTGNFWLKQKDTQQHVSDVYVGKAAANAAALELLKQQPELKGNLVITAYGPGEQPG